MKGGKKILTIVFTMAILITIALGGTQKVFANEKAYPEREISVYVGFPPGGSMDSVARVLTEVLKRELGVPVIVVNKPGAGGSLAASYIANTKPDGYSLTFLSMPGIIIKKIMEPSLTYGHNTYTPLGFSYMFYSMLSVRADSPWKTYEEFIDHARKKAVKFGTGNTFHEVYQNQLKEKLGLKTIIAPFGAGGPAVKALLGGHIDAVTISAGPTGKYVRSGDLRWLAYLAPNRSSVYSDIPSIQEKEQEKMPYCGSGATFVGPPNLPDAIANKMREALKKAAQSEEIKKLLIRFSFDYVYQSPDDFVSSWTEDEETLKRELKKLGIVK